MSDPNRKIRHLYRLRFARTDAAIWLGHLDMMRTFERSLRRAKLPVTYSGGFNPRPELVFALPAAVGIATEHDYLDVPLAIPHDPVDIVDRLNTALPPGISVSEAWALPEGSKNMMGLVREADYRLEFKGAAATAACLTEAASLSVTKISKGKERDVDLRPLIIHAIAGIHTDALLVRCLAGSANNLRMDNLCDALVQYCGIDRQIIDDAYLVREELYILQDGKVKPPKAFA